MRLPKHQKTVFLNLDRVRVKPNERGRLRYTLDGVDCGYPINCLIIKGLVSRDNHGNVRRAEGMMTRVIELVA